MQIELLERATKSTNAAPKPKPKPKPTAMAMATRYEDPLDPDVITDVPVLTTQRALLRVALVAAETATRFAREGLESDPMAWMVVPRRLFDGRSAIEGCLGRDECLRAIVLHGLSMGLDADPEAIDALVDEDDDDEGPDEDVFASSDPDAFPAPPPKLWTSLLAGQSSSGIIHAFDAVIAADRVEAEARLRGRHGATLADDLQIIEGYDASLPLAEALVSPALSDMLSLVAANPASPLAEGLSVSVRQHFAA